MSNRLQAAVVPAIETLEGRVLLSASVEGLALTVDGNATTPNKINVSYIRKTHSIRVVANRVRQDFPVAGLTDLQITGGSARDVITVAAGISLPTTINGMGGNDLITGKAENDTIITGLGNSVIHPGLGINSIDLTLGSNKAVLTKKAVDTIIATTQDKVIGATSSTQILAPSTPAGAPVSPPAPPAPPVPPLPPAPSSPPVLKPGTGFTGPTVQPAQIGTGFASTENAIARWDVVPYQTFSGTFNVGVVAFHSNGIDHVSFSVNGGDWVDVSQMTLNPQTNVTEYVAQLNAADFADGPVEVRAIISPRAGVPVVLQGSSYSSSGYTSLFLNADTNHTLASIVEYVSTSGSDTAGDGTSANPFATIMKAAHAIQVTSPSHDGDGGTIYLMPGDYVYGTYTYSLLTDTTSRWLTITPAPGVSRDQVRLTSEGTSDGIRTKLVHLENLTIQPVSGSVQIISSNSALDDYLWVDGCQLIGLGRTVTGEFTGGWTAHYVTDSDISNSVDGVPADLVRNTVVHDIGSDAFSNSGIVINCVARNIDSSGTLFHPDVVQYYASPGITVANRIVYGLSATVSVGAQGLFAGAGVSIKDVAFVNCDIDNDPVSMYTFQFGGPTQNLYVEDDTFSGVLGALWRTDLGFLATDVVIDSATFSSGPGAVTGVTYR